jgi:creatinine amidohydrolase
VSEEILYTVKGPKSLPDMTWAEVAEILEETDTVIVPVASTEQHGPHLPLATDTIQAIEIAKRAVASLATEGIKVVAGPTIPFGLAPYHMPFPGTISLSADTLKAVIREVCTSLYEHGFRKFALLLGHGGNYGVMQVAAQELVVELPESQVVFLNFLPALEAKYPEFLLSGRPEGHSGEGETARILLTHPNLVQMERAQEYYSPEADEAESEDHPLLGGGIYTPVRDWSAVTPYGSAGNPTLATAENGKKGYDVIVNWVCDAIKHTLLSD